MIAVIFEGIPHEGKMEEYLNLAPKYAGVLRTMDGFISNERFQSCVNPGKVLSISYWRDEESIRRFRQLEMHVRDERLGREDLFADFSISICEVSRHYTLTDRRDAPTP